MKQVIVIRKDLNMRKGKMIAAGAHASLNAILLCATNPCHPNHDLFLKWLLDHHERKIAVSVDSEAELLDVHQKATEQGMLASLIQDIGLTEFQGVHTYTAVAIGPDEDAKIDAITGGLKLL